MTSRRWIIIFWVLVLVPAVILAGVAFSLLSHEKDRIRNAAVRALTDRARAIAQSIDLAVVTVQDNLTQTLYGLEGDSLETRLVAWEKTSPLVRNVFIFHSDTGLEYPLSSMAATQEERQFGKRFAPLFTGRLSFDFNRIPLDQKTEKKTLASRSSTRDLYDLSRAKMPDQAGQTSETSTRQQSPGLDSGWIPWYSDNRLYILGWVQKNSTGPVYGVELEVMTLLSRLVADFPDNTQPGTSLALMDGSGYFIHQSGPLGAGPDQTPMARVDVSPGLPHWQIGVFSSGDAVDTGVSFFVIALVLLGILIIAILSGGILITRLTLEKIKDARQKTSFVASVSHELKTPLTSIRMYAELLLSRRVTDPDKQGQYLSVIVGESLRLTRLINNVLDFGKLEQGKKRYHPILFDVSPFLAGVIQAQKIRMHQAGLEIIKEIPLGQFWVHTDQDAVEQALLNLLDNALKYAGNGRYLKFILARDSQQILVSIQDDGPGIEGMVREKIFEKFFRADDSITASQPGSGLGLSIARQMLRDLGGDLVLEPESKTSPGVCGACFTLGLPNKRLNENGTD